MIGDLRSGQAFDSGCICDTTKFLLPGSTIAHCQCSVSTTVQFSVVVLMMS